MGQQNQTPGGVFIDDTNGKRGVMYYFNCGKGNGSGSEAEKQGKLIKQNLPTYLAEKNRAKKLDYWVEKNGG